MSSEPGYSQHRRAELRAWSCSHWSLPQVGSGRWWPVGFAHTFRKDLANHMETLLYISKKFIFPQKMQVPIEDLVLGIH